MMCRQIPQPVLKCFQLSQPLGSLDYEAMLAFRFASSKTEMPI